MSWPHVHDDISRGSGETTVELEQQEAELWGQGACGDAAFPPGKAASIEEKVKEEEEEVE